MLLYFHMVFRLAGNVACFVSSFAVFLLCVDMHKKHLLYKYVLWTNIGELIYGYIFNVKRKKIG